MQALVQPSESTEYSPALATMTTGAAGGGRRFEPSLEETLAAALAFEDFQSTTADQSRAPRSVSGGLVEYGRSLSQNELVEVQLKVSKTRSFAPSTAILRNHWQKKSSLEEAMLEIYFGNISVAKGEEIVRLFWGDTASLATVTAECRKLCARIREWLEGAILREHRYVYLDTLRLKQRIGGQIQINNLAIATGIGVDGTREILGITDLSRDGPDGWNRFLESLRHRGLRQVKLLIGGLDRDLASAAEARFPSARYQAGLLHLDQEVLSLVPTARWEYVRTRLDAIRAMDTREKALVKAAAVRAELRLAGLTEAAETLDGWSAALFNYFFCPRAHWGKLRDGQPLKTILQGFRERVRLIGPITESGVMILLLAARLRHLSRSQRWKHRRFLPV